MKIYSCESLRFYSFAKIRNKCVKDKNIVITAWAIPSIRGGGL